MSRSKSSVDVSGTPLSSGRPLPRECDGSAAVRIVVQRPSSGCKTRRCHPSTRMLREQGRHVIYRHSGCREPAVIYRRPMLPGFGIHLDVGDSGVQFGAGQMSAAGLHAALKVQVRAARHRTGLASNECATCVRFLERIVKKSPPHALPSCRLDAHTSQNLHRAPLWSHAQTRSLWTNRTRPAQIWAPSRGHAQSSPIIVFPPPRGCTGRASRHPEVLHPHASPPPRDPDKVATASPCGQMPKTNVTLQKTAAPS